MKKKCLSILLILAMLVPTLASCSGTPNETDSDISGVNQETTEQQTKEEGSEDPAELSLVTDGVSDYVIVRGENAVISEITASTELQSYLKQITGAELPIVTDSTPAVKKEIIVGKTNREAEGQFDREELGEEGFVIKTDAGKLWLVGGEVRGTLYAVYTFLEDYLGCRFYTSNFEKIPKTKTISLQIEEDKQIPVFEVRTTDWSDMNGTTTPVKRKLNSLEGIADAYGGQYQWAGGMCHTLPALAEIGNGYGPEPCLSDENVYETVLKNVRSMLAATPDAKFISVSQADVDSPCTCADCKASIAVHGNSGHYLLFVNRIAEEIRDEYPDVKIHTFAYWFTVMPPKSDVVPAENVMVQLCTIEACFSHPLEECDWMRNNGGNYLEEGANFADLFTAWSELTSYLSVWDYTTNYSSPQVTFSDFRVLRENIQFFAENGTKFLFEEGWDENGEFSGLRSYLLAKLMWDPYMSEEEYYGYMDEFLADYYGPGWESIRAYIDMTEEATEDIHFGCFVDNNVLFPMTEDKTNKDRELPTFTADQLRNFTEIDWEQYSDWLTVYTLHPLITSGYELFAQAMEQAETDAQREHIDQSSIQLDFVNSWYLYAWTHRQCRSTVNKIFKNAVSVCVAEGTLTEEEGAQLTERFADEVIESILTAYSEYNKQIAYRMLKYGVTRISLNHILSQDNVESMNYAGLPGGGSSAMWID